MFFSYLSSEIPNVCCYICLCWYNKVTTTTNLTRALRFFTARLINVIVLPKYANVLNWRNLTLSLYTTIVHILSSIHYKNKKLELLRLITNHDLTQAVPRNNFTELHNFESTINVYIPKSAIRKERVKIKNNLNEYFNNAHGPREKVNCCD